ncbi:hypothetical protein ANANG_G00092930 [Anguilla anguilla]|uniref:WW domain-containing protein n=1 Tax=Anguilla anguilla TaxID=7936 RepID=A0A9D3S1Q6_ANGAN|nr:hypothetical protein ANANG_G00092930 [Anguilla anguilla]
MSNNQLQPMPGQQVIHVAQDLDTDLEALFNSVMSPKPSSWRNKLLPESFFKEPDSGSHSRQSSTDSGSHPPRLTVQHVRSHSSPASLQLGTGANVAPSPAHHAHLRQQSFDVVEDLPLPPGWEMAFTSTGQRYFLNHVEKITTWQDPRKTLAMKQIHSLHGPAAPTAVQQRSMALSQPNLVMTHRHQTHPPPQIQQQQQQQQASVQAQALVSSPPVSQQTAAPAEDETAEDPAGEGVHPHEARGANETGGGAVQAAAHGLRQHGSRPPAVNPASMNQGSVPSNSTDPFLNSGPFHSREQSTDSGLGLGCYSIPTTPEDFLNNVDEMDTGESLPQVNMAAPQPSRFPDFLDSLPGTNVDLGTLEGADLLPILNDMESVLNKSEPFLTWL